MTNTRPQPSADRASSLESEVRQLEHELTEARQRADKLEAELRELRAKVDGSGPRFAALYADFIERFRGSTAEVAAKLAGYLPDVRRLAGHGSTGVVDVGSGRGEWLALLRDAGVPAAGVDSHPAFVDAARARGLDVVHGDAIVHLQGLPPESVDVVSAFHVIEHLDVETVLELYEAAHCALRQGGCLIVETPNPTNLRMAACDFYNDPTHRAPLPPALTEYLVSASGFVDVEMRPLHPNEYGPQDYAVLGYKPQPAE